MPKEIYQHKKLSEEHKRNISLGNMGRIFDEQTRKKISESRKKRKEKIGFLNSPETRLKMSIAAKGKRNSPATEFKKGLTPWNKGRSTQEQKDRSRASILLRHKYGIDLDIYEDILEKQKGLCLICGESETKKTSKGTVSRLHIDHDHKTGIVRGLLCHKCNCAIGLFREDISIMEKAIKYLSV